MAPARPSGPHLAQRLRTLALTSPPTTALFYARIYRALFPSNDADHDSLHVLALCQLAAGNAYPALGLVRDFADGDLDPASNDILDMEGGITARRPGCHGCAVIVAKCCNKLNRVDEGRAVLARAMRRSSTITLPTPCPAETSATNSLLLAQLSHKGKEPDVAIAYYTRALADDPWLWEAFTGLCDVGGAPPADAMFPEPPSMLRTSSQRTSRQPTLSPGPMPRSSASEVPNFLNRRQLSPLAGTPTLFTPDPGAGAVPSRVHMMGNMSGWDSPPSAIADTTFPTIAEHTASVPNGRTRVPNLITQFIPGLRSTPTMEQSSPPKPPAMKRPRGGNGRRPVETPTVGGPLATESRLNRDLRSMELNGDTKVIDPPVRRSSRLNTSTKTSTRVTREKRSTRSQSVTSSASGHTETSPATLEAQTQAAVDDWLRDVVRRCARAYRALSLFQCKEALAEIDALPTELLGSPWALELVARCFYFMAENAKGRRAFMKLIDAEPYGLASMELYSTLLWHLGDSTALSHLSQTLMSVDRESSQAWIAAGNMFSVLEQHDEASRCFRRATQLDPSSSYAWVLCGHEAFMMEEEERAIAFYRTAIRADPREHAAWFGMGRVYHQLGKPRHAEHHFRRAVEINPSSATLLCCLGDAVERSGNLEVALAEFDRAAALGDELSRPMTHYKRARILVALGRINEAIAALEPLVRTSSDEAMVHFLLAKCYLKAGRNADAVVAFTSAREISPKLESAIRTVLVAGGEDVAEEDV